MKIERFNENKLVEERISYLIYDGNDQPIETNEYDTYDTESLKEVVEFLLYLREVDVELYRDTNKYNV